MFEVLNFYLPKINSSSILSRLGQKPQNYFVVSAHREENIEPEKNFLKLVNIVNETASRYCASVLVSTHPRTRNRIEGKGLKFHPNVQLLKPLSFTDYVNLQLHSKAVLSDSGTINEESSILNFPALNLREAHERPEGMEKASVMMVGLEIDRINQVLPILEQQSTEKERTLPIVEDYDEINVSEKVLRVIHSYTDYVNRVVWKKY